jgi:two-component system phosphate regulon sensor histidine kinase PhoR
MLLDASGTIICANRFFAPLMRNKPEDTPGTPADWELRSPKLIKIIAEARNGSVSEGNFVYRQGGAEMFYKARAVPTGTGEMLAVLDDETERKRMETARKTFVADAGHELQTPLSAISAAAELLAGMENSAAPEREPYIKEIMRQRERMTVLVDDLLLLSRLESGMPFSKPESLNISQMCEMLLNDAMHSPLAQNISWSVDLPPEEIYIEARCEELQRAVSNLLDNAVKYVNKRYRDKQGGVILFSLNESPDGALVLRVEDNGIGIPEDKLNRIFGRFERVEEDRAREGGKTGGYGLGLAIAKHAVESHGGRIEAHSSDGSTVFTVTLPKV